MKDQVLLYSAVFLLVFGGASSKVYQRCELARELLNVHGIARYQLGDCKFIKQILTILLNNADR